MEKVLNICPNCGNSDNPPIRFCERCGYEFETFDEAEGNNYEIGKLLNGEPDPCYTCKNSDTESCDYCDNYNQYVA